MPIQLVGETEVLMALENASSDLVDDQAHSLASKTTPRSPTQMPTVSIPDVSDDSESHRRPGFKSNHVLESRIEGQTISNLETIRNAIEQSLNDNEQKLTQEQQIQQLKKAIEGSAQTSIDERPMETETSETDEFGLVEEVAKPVKDLRSKSRCFLAKLGNRDPQIEPVVELVCEKFSKEGHSILSFAGSEKNEQLGSVVARTAAMLHHRTNSRILIVDCDLESNALAELLHANGPGLADMNRVGENWETAVTATSFENIDVVSVGEREQIDRGRLSQAIKNVVSRMRDDYNYVLVNVGDAHGESSRDWSNHVNGTFLLVSLEKSNQDVAKSAVALLNSCGARLLGCVVSEKDTD